MIQTLQPPLATWRVNSAGAGLPFVCPRVLRPGQAGSTTQKQFGGVYIANEKYTQALAEQVIHDGEADAVAFGQLFIANPDLPVRFANNAPLNTPDPATYFTPGPHGYTDYPALSAPQEVMALAASELRGFTAWTRACSIEETS
jgi:hypothetical protein